jgi:regulator of sigma E protease
VPAELLHLILSNTWSVFLIVLFFGGSIFVHELGHYLAARARGVHVEVFSIGWAGDLLVEGRGRHSLPGRVVPARAASSSCPRSRTWGRSRGKARSTRRACPRSPTGPRCSSSPPAPPSTSSFAFLLACVVWRRREPENNESDSTTIGYVSRTIDLPDGDQGDEPRHEAGLRVGDVVKAIDGTRDRGLGRAQRHADDGLRARPRREAHHGLHRRAGGPDGGDHAPSPNLRRRQGAPRRRSARGTTSTCTRSRPNTAMAQGRLLAGDRIVSLNGQPIMNPSGLERGAGARPVEAGAPGRRARRQGPRPRAAARAWGSWRIGDVEFTTGYHMTHPSPIRADRPALR